MDVDDGSSKPVPGAGALRVLYFDPLRPDVAVWSDLPVAQHDKPLPELTRASTEDDGLRDGTYVFTGDQRDGRWVYLLDEASAT